MKKTLEYLYIFSKLSTSFILLFSILILGYFFYSSYKNQENAKYNQQDFLNKLNSNAEKLSDLSKKIVSTDSKINELNKLIQNNSNITPEQITLLNEKITELYSKIENISVGLESVKSNAPSTINQTNNKSNIILEKNRKELAELIIFKFENNLDYNEELKILRDLSNQKNQYIFEKINLIQFKNFRGNSFLTNVFSEELEFFIKEKYTHNKNNFIFSSVMKFISIEPSQKNQIKNNEINILKEITNLIDRKQYKKSKEKILSINNYEEYFKESINQIQIIIEFKKLIKEVS